MSALRRVFCLFVAIVIVLSAFPLLSSVSADTASVRSRKLVSIVYDDSGSMAGEKWEYTNYAMQCFVAMLNSEDKLDITYMSSYNQAKSVDTTDRNSSVTAIRKHSASSGTPADSIDTAFKALTAHNDTDPTSQYWLVVMTDGDMSGSESAEDKINGYADKKMPNGTKPQIIYMTICDTGKTFTPSFSKSNIEVRSPLTAQEVTKVISDIACKISGRYEVAASDIKLVDSKTVEISTKLPLTRMGILIQRSPARVDKITGVEGAELKQEYSVPVELPHMYDVLPQEEVDTLRGNISLFCASSGNISPGSYTIHLTEDVKKEDLVIMFEPAFALRIEISCNGTKVDDLSSLVASNSIDIEAVLYEAGTDNKISISDLPSGAKEQIDFLLDGKSVNKVSALKMTGAALKEGDIRIEAMLNIPGFFTVTDVVTFAPKDISLTNITAELFYDGSKRRKDEAGNLDPENVVYVTSFKENETGIKFTLHTDEGPIDKTRALSLKDEFTRALKLDISNYKVTVADDGSFIVAPTKTWIPDIIYWAMHKGDLPIEVTMDGFTASDTLCIKMGDWIKAAIDFIIFLIILWLIIRTILWIFKPRFKGDGTFHLYSAAEKYDSFDEEFDHCKSPNILSSHCLLNWLGLRGMRILVGPFYIRATKGGGYQLDKAKGKYIHTSDPYPDDGYHDPFDGKHYPFTNTVHIYEGGRYYKIEVTRE